MKKIFLVLPLLIILISGCSLWTEKDSSGVKDNTINEDKGASMKDEKNIKQDDVNGNYTVDMDETKITWSGEKFLQFGHTGTIDLKESNIVFSKEHKFRDSSFVIDMNSIKEDKNNEAVVKHLKSADFFDVEKYPIAEIIIKEVENISDGKYNITANLMIKGISNEINFIGNISDLNNDRIMAKSHFVIDRSKWDVRFGSNSFFDNLGDKAIKDEIEFFVDLVVYKNK